MRCERVGVTNLVGSGDVCHLVDNSLHQVAGEGLPARVVEHLKHRESELELQDGERVVKRVYRDFHEAQELAVSVDVAHHTEKEATQVT